MKRSLHLSDGSQAQSQPPASRSLPSEADERLFIQLVATGVLRLRYVHTPQQHWLLEDTQPWTRTPDQRVWKQFNFRWDAQTQTWYTYSNLPPSIVDAWNARRRAEESMNRAQVQSTNASAAAAHVPSTSSSASSSASDDAQNAYKQQTRVVLNRYRDELVDNNNHMRFVFSPIVMHGRSSTRVQPRDANIKMYDYRHIWNVLKLYFDSDNRFWLGRQSLASIVDEWYRQELHRRRAEAEERQRVQEEERRRQEEARRQAEEKEHERQLQAAARLAEIKSRLDALYARARVNPNNLNANEQVEYENLRNAPGMVVQDYAAWDELYDRVYATIRDKLRRNEGLTEEEAAFLISDKRLAIDDAIEAVRVETEDMEVNEKLRRNPATSVAKEQELNPFWVAHVVNAVLELTKRLTDQIHKHLSDNQLDIGTTRVPMVTNFETPLGELRVFVRNQAAPRRVVWNVSFNSPQLAAIANRALLDAGYQHPTQIREAKSLIIAMNAVASHLAQLEPGPNGIERKVREWAREKKASELVFGNGGFGHA